MTEYKVPEGESNADHDVKKIQDALDWAKKTDQQVTIR